jgi:hypothetical protein
MVSEYPAFKVARRESLPPNDQRAGDIYARLGYRIADAIADLVDNSVDAGAPHVLIRFVRSAAGIHQVLIVDDGQGMDAPRLREAMRFGSESEPNDHRLGKYGIGLKSASLSQADVVTVLSRTKRTDVGRRWTLENIKKQWSCEILEEAGISDAFGMSFCHVKPAKAGTMVIWERLEHLRALPSNIDRVLERTIDDVSVELGIRFHRFLERKQLQIGIDQHFVGEGEPATCRFVIPLNPFDYPASGHADYPLTLKADVNGTKVDLICHIWPPKTSSPGYRLGGGQGSAPSGFLFLP